jgi:hypothetical protein
MIALSIVQGALNGEDLEGLLQLGAPADEYKSEALDIISVIAEAGPSALTEDTLTGVIESVWIRTFGPFSVEEVRQRKAGFRRVARTILSELASMD